LWQLNDMSGPKLFHVSEDAGLHKFTPRPTSGPASNDPLVWAVDEAHLPNYLLPRDCPRVCFAPAEWTTNDDRNRFFSATTASRIITVESAWYERITACTLFLYELPRETFIPQDRNAGYWVTQSTVECIAKTEAGDLVAALFQRRAELRIVPSLWPIWDAVMASSLSFSMIRMRNAQPRLLD
jgi:hypothetical protein